MGIEQESSDGGENDVTTFSFNLQEPLKIDKLSDMYLDSFTTLNCVQGDTTAHDATGFILKLDQFNINTVTTPNVGTTAQKLFNSIFSPLTFNKCKKTTPSFCVDTIESLGEIGPLLVP